MQPQINELIESNARKEMMYNHRKRFERTCISCRIGWGVIGGAMCVLSAVRVREIWSHLPYLTKGANVGFVAVLGLFSITQFQVAYVCYLGRTMQLVTIETETKDELGDLKAKLMLEEERAEVRRKIDD
jgi:hypothetical protein